MAKLLDGVEASKSLRAQVAEGVLEMQQKHGVTPGLAAVLVGDDPASAVYVRNKERACAEVGILSEVFRLPQDASEGWTAGDRGSIERRCPISWHPSAASSPRCC